MEESGWMSFTKFATEEGEDVAIAAIADQTVRTQLNPILKGPRGDTVNDTSILFYVSQHSINLQPLQLRVSTYMNHHT